jgi:acyl-CoA thioesterase
MQTFDRGAAVTPPEETAKGPPQRPDLDVDLQLDELGGGRFTAVLARHWWLDRGPNGGFLAALVLAAAARAASPDRVPCSLTLHYVAAAQEGPVELQVDVQREGRLLTNCSVRVEQDGRPVTTGLVALTAPRATAKAYDDTTFPRAPGPETVPPLPPDMPGLPPFIANYDMRFVSVEPGGELPPNAGAAWLRMAAERRPDALAVTAFADALPPSPWRRLGAALPTPTIDLTVHFRDHGWYGEAVKDEFVLGLTWSRLMANGLFEEEGQLWSPSGVLLAQSRQLAFLLG